jgi:mono/diheme cytochrome c family protein
MKNRPLLKPAAFFALMLAGSLFVAAGARGGEDNLVAHIAEGRAAFVENCGACHGIGRPETKNMDRAAWDLLITSMEAKGANLEAGERELILDYLGIRNIFLTKCTSCHTTERILKREQNFAAWKETVTRMANKGPDILAEGEARSIIAYLTALRGAPAEAK